MDANEKLVVRKSRQVAKWRNEKLHRMLTVMKLCSVPNLNNYTLGEMYKKKCLWITLEEIVCTWFDLQMFKEILNLDNNHHVSPQFDLQITIAIILAVI